jgi:hypothetical protein
MLEKVRPYVEGTPWEGTVNIERVEATEAELKAARAETERMLGHSTIAQTLDTYSHVMPSMSDATAVAMNEALA